MFEDLLQVISYNKYGSYWHAESLSGTSAFCETSAALIDKDSDERVSKGC